MSSIVELLDEVRKLMELKGENPFKIRAFEKAAQVLAGCGDLKERVVTKTLTELPGVGQGIASVVTEYVLTGHSTLRDELAQSLPTGLLELTEIPGLGPKKARALIETFGIQSVAELEYACKENRLVNLKGFGLKTQKKILDGILFQQANRGFRKFSESEALAEKFLREIQNVCKGSRISETGALRRKLEILSELDFLVELIQGEETQSLAQHFVNRFQLEHPGGLPIRLHFSNPEQFGYVLAKTTGTESHWNSLGSPAPSNVKTEEEFYEHLALPWLPPEVRETGEEVALARAGSFPELLPWQGIRGVFHNHTNRSDGVATLEEMVSTAESLGFEYIGISDHSQSAFYAQGLREETLLEQEAEIKLVQKKYPKIRIFWGIESDILADGSLDYDETILKRFDFVIASIHSRFNMNKEEMTERILRAIRNPFTRFLGHPTGRILLGRKGYEMDMEAIIAEAAKNRVVIELNANPARLDFDWRWGGEMRKQGTLTSVNPDAHETAGLKDTRYGVAMARKALLPVGQVLNAKSCTEVEQWLKRA